MTAAEARTRAEQFVADAGLEEVGPVYEVRYSDGSEFIDCAPPPPRWIVYFAYNGPPHEDLPEERKGLLSSGWDDPTIVIVDDASGRVELFSSL